MQSLRLITVVELPLFLKKVESVLDETEKEALINYLAANPEKGGLLKIRVKEGERGSSIISITTQPRFSCCLSMEKGHKRISHRKKRKS